MPAVTIDASVVDGSSNKLYPNPVPTIEGAININSENAGDLSSPVAFSANALDPELPPFALNHARILYENLLSNSAVTATAGTSPSFTLIPNTAQRYTFINTQTITFTLPSAVSMDTVCIGAHNLSGKTILVEYSSSDVGAFTTFAPSKSPTTNNAIMFHIDTAVSVRRLQITVTGTGSFYIGSVYAGIALQMQRPFFGGHTPAVLARQADYYSSMSESGNFIGVEVRRRALESSAAWKNITDTWYRTYFVPFLASAEILPFYFAWNLLQYSDDVAYCKNITNIAPSYSGQRDLMSVDIPLIGIA